MLSRMAHRLRPRLTFGTVVAVVALFVALGGTSVGQPVVHAGASAASNLKQALKLGHKADRNSRHALKLARKADANAKAALAKSGVAGPAGAGGGPGLQGQPGSALGFAQVEYCPGVCPDQSTPGWFVEDEGSHVVDNMANFANPQDGVYCFSNLLFEAHNAVAVMAPNSHVYILQGRAGTIDTPVGSPCTPVGLATHNAMVEVRDPATGSLVEPDHSVQFAVVFN